MKYQVEQTELQRLATVYNNLLTIHTSGTDTFMMTDCMRLLEQTIQSISSEDHIIKEEKED